MIHKKMRGSFRETAKTNRKRFVRLTEIAMNTAIAQNKARLEGTYYGD
ncbi:MAG: hypothetical protein Pg6A_06240 [Termitinemataceae bacterium]|nr:MAG: hypothetical protein Pg6A_06240 [Termitinemataceae bacterium]